MKGTNFLRRVLAMVLAAAFFVGMGAAVPTAQAAAGAPLPDGEYVIWAPKYNMALSGLYPGGSYYNAGVKVQEEGGKLSGYADTEVWTVENQTDGTITISRDGLNLGMADSYSSLSLGAPHDKWVLEDAGNGLYYVKNVQRECYIEWYSDYTRWSGYHKIASGAEGLFALKFTPAEQNAPTDSLAGYITVSPGPGGYVPEGTELTIFCGIADAAVSFRLNGGQWETYSADHKPVIQTLPCDLEVKVQQPGQTDSQILTYRYTLGMVEDVTMTPNGGSIFIEDQSRTILLACETEGAVIHYATSTDGKNFSVYQEYTQPIEVRKGFGQLTIKAYAEKEGYTTGSEITRTITERENQGYEIYFGQLHSHTTISDGSGSVREAFNYASKVEGLDFLAVTDHSNSLDNNGSGVLAQDGKGVSSEWRQGQEAAASVTDEDFVGLYGFEMTWSNGLGHINTFNTPGWQSRTQSQFQTASTALQNYYDALATVPGSISQFNHPGTAFGDFSDFGHYSQRNDDLITLIEVGNGSGTVGSSGYFPSYEYYTRALDKGWHVAPVNNQDNHRGMWGDSNTCRSVVLADSLTPEGIYDALRNCRVYATEDKDLRIYYSLEGQIMGSRVNTSDVGDTVTLTVEISDATDKIGTVEVIVNGGYSLTQQTVDSGSETVTFTVPADYSYYYIRITQPDGDIAVTAPVWVGHVEALGISDLSVESAVTVAGETQTFRLELYNNERSSLIIDTIEFTNTATGEVIHRETGIPSVEPESTVTCSFDYIFPRDGACTVAATVKGTLEGVQKVYTGELELKVMPGGIISTIIVDGTHYNDYVTGYYGGNMTNLASLGASQGVQVHLETDEITPDMLKNCSLLVISAPARKSGNANTGAYGPKPFEDSFIAMVADYVKNGGSVILCGLADYQDKGASGGKDNHIAAQMNKLLEAMGSTMRINDDEAMDDRKNGGQSYRLYPQTFNMDSPWCAGLRSSQSYSTYSGCTVDPGQGTWLVRGFDSTYSIDSDRDGLGGVKKGEAVFLAAEQTPYGGTVFAAGSVFVSNYEIEAESANSWDLPYANHTILENIISGTRTSPEITPIAQVRASAEAELGRIFIVEGTVTAGTANSFGGFFDTVYLQDETGGIALFPYSDGGLKPGTKLRVTGYTDSFQDDLELQILSMEVLGTGDAPIPQKLPNTQAMDYSANGGKLLQVEGLVTEVSLTPDGSGIAWFTVTDEAGGEATVFIDGYVLSGTTGQNTLAASVQVGSRVEASGILYMRPDEQSGTSAPALRVRDCDDVVLLQAAPTVEAPEAPAAGSGSNTLIIVVIVVIAVLCAAAAVAVILILRKRRHEK